MSTKLFFGFKTELQKRCFSNLNVFDIPEGYKTDYWFNTEIVFDANISENMKKVLKNSKEYYWYELKCALHPFDVNPKIKEDMPDYYEASKQLTKWFIDFIKKKLVNKINVVMLIWWEYDKDKKLEISNYNLDLIDISNCKLPYNQTFNIFIDNNSLLN